MNNFPCLPLAIDLQHPSMMALLQFKDTTRVSTRLRYRQFSTSRYTLSVSRSMRSRGTRAGFIAVCQAVRNPECQNSRYDPPKPHLTYHASRITSHASRLTYHVPSCTSPQSQRIQHRFNQYNQIKPQGLMFYVIQIILKFLNSVFF